METTVVEEVKLHLYRVDTSSSAPLPYADGGIRAGFPSPAQDYLSESIDLNRELIHHHETTFYARVVGDSMQGAGIFEGDIVIIDKALDAKDGDLIAAYVDGEFTLKRFKLDETGRCAWLIPANPRYRPIKVTAENDFMVWGVVTGVVRKLHR
ncbi:MAG: translesion error-prone DNA polymerase V autoproteolytic subunit [Bacteroidales bacterium]|nr:translesion error-prone DNA polymerase V autoproteolytic subunit [Bacteroidales bacterium]